MSKRARAEDYVIVTTTPRNERGCLGKKNKDGSVEYTLADYEYLSRRVMNMAEDLFRNVMVEKFAEHQPPPPQQLGRVVHVCMKEVDPLQYDCMLNFANGMYFVVGTHVAYCAMPYVRETCLYNMVRHTFHHTNKPYQELNNPEYLAFFKWLTSEKCMNHGTKTFMEYVLDQYTKMRENPTFFLCDNSLSK